MKGITVLVALVWSATSGAALWGPWSGVGTDVSTAAKPAISAPPVRPVVADARRPLVQDDGPATWTLVLIGATVLCFVALRQAD